MADERRRTRAVVVALLVVVAAAVVLTLRCVTARDADETPRDGVGGDADAVAETKSGNPTTGAGSGRRADGPIVSKATKPQGTSRSRAKTTSDAASDATTRAESADAKTAASATSPSRDETYGRFTLVGESGAHFGRDFGGSVAIDGDVAVIGAPGLKVGDVACGAAFVYERKDGRWTETQRLDSPRPDVAGFSRYVGVSGARIVVFDGLPGGKGEHFFCSYVRGEDGRWTEEAYVPVPDGICYHSAFRGDTVVIPVLHAIDVWRLGESGWKRAQRIADRGSGRSRCLWISLAGDTLAYARNDDLRSDRSISFFRLRDGSYEDEVTVAWTGPIDVGWGTLARGGTALVCFDVAIPVLVVEERSGREWTRKLAATNAWGQFTAHGSHPVAADGDLVIATSRDWDAFRVLQRRDDGWYWTSMGPKAPAGRHFMWPAWFANVAISGRSVVVGTDLDGSNTGRAWFFDITDDDLAHATKIESDTK